MHALFVHGLGRSPLSAWPMLRQLRRSGLSANTFAYWAAFESFERIRLRLVRRLTDLAAQEADYILIGHSLGGVLLRAALASLPPQTRLPRHLFLIASPISSACLARKLHTNPIFRFATGDCGQLLASDARMASIPASPVPATAIIGIQGLPWISSVFAGELNDGVVALSEVRANWLHQQIHVQLIHTLLPASSKVGEIILRTVLS
ncbi:esterase/lipase family protein [Candidatus Electronema sp. PJ]|uniref:esterase/lipase family protein n=1 Tax=Candidatus Electronema sp. PJ TaxID=3401572 RepID=UPI003AA9ACFE